MARKELALANGFNYTGVGTGNGTVEANAKRIDDNFAELYVLHRSYGITASEQMAPADTSVETANTQKLTIPANTLQAGDRLRIRGLARVTGQNATDTLRDRLRIGGLTGVQIAAVLPYDAANNDNIRFEADLWFESVGIATASKFHSVGRAKRTGGSDEDTFVVDNTTLDTTAAIDIVHTQVWSADNATNRVKLYELTADLLRKVAA